MPLSPFNDNIDLAAPKDLDQRKGKFVGGAWLPFASVAEANAANAPTKRHIGLTVNVAVAGIPTQYWYRDGIGDGNLVLKFDVSKMLGYGTGTHTGTLAYIIGVTSAGDVVEVPVESALPVYANDAAADADVALLSNSLYKIVSSRIVRQKP